MLLRRNTAISQPYQGQYERISLIYDRRNHDLRRTCVTNQYDTRQEGSRTKLWTHVFVISNRGEVTDLDNAPLFYSAIGYC